MAYKTIKIGFIGLGTVGQGVWKHIEGNRRRLESRLGVSLELHRAAVRDLEKERPVTIPTDKLTTDSMGVATDPEIDIVCELMGGTSLARELTLAALEAGKIVVSANKALLCEHGQEIFAAARRGGGHFFFEASVAGGIPIIKALREGLVANGFKLIYGILNGTCNYILTRMEREGASFDSILDEARKLGYVEADESLDLDGWDTAHKAVILAFLAHGKWVTYDEMLVEGIRKISQEDIRETAALGYSIKLLAAIERDFQTHKLFISVRPSLISRQNVVANLGGPYNGVSVTGDVVGTTLYIGRGAGQDATASAVISDIADAALLLRGDRVPLPTEEEDDIRLADTPCGILPLDHVRGEYYLRLTVKDAPGVLAQVAAVMAGKNVSIATVNQKERPGQASASLILTTHESNERDIQQTVKDLNDLPTVLEEPLLLRIANFEE
jgi:homoserine dehydrogenase